jgi:hypothetical protein
MSADNNHETGTAPVSLPPEYIAIRLILAIAEAEPAMGARSHLYRGELARRCRPPNRRALLRQRANPADHRSRICASKRSRAAPSSAPATPWERSQSYARSVPGGYPTRDPGRRRSSCSR